MEFNKARIWETAYASAFANYSWERAEGEAACRYAIKIADAAVAELEKEYERDEDDSDL